LLTEDCEWIRDIGEVNIKVNIVGEELVRSLASDFKDVE
jgi:hypothetical protein